MLAWGKNKHKHQWKAKATHQLTIYTTGYVKPTGFTTDVLQVCVECGESKTVTLRGHWTVEQLTA